MKRIYAQCSLDSRDEMICVYGFGEKVNGSALHGLHCKRNVSVRREKNNRHANLPFNENLLHLQPVGRREAEVEDEAARIGQEVPSKKFLRIGINADLPAFERKQAGERVTDIGIVVNNANDSGLHSAAPS